MCENDVDLQPDKLVCDLRVALVASFGPTNLDRNVATFDPAEFAQALHNSGDMLALGRTRTSSARARTVADTSRRSVLAVLRLSTVSYLVGVCTGRSAGFSPLRIRST